MTSQANSAPSQSKRAHPPDRWTSDSGIVSASIVAALTRQAFFAGASAEAMLHLTSQARWRICAENETIMDSGDTTDDVFFIVEGAVRIILYTTLGYEAVLNEMSAGEFFGELAAIDGIQRSANVTALRPTRLCVVPATAFMELVYSSREVAQRLLCLLSRRLRSKDERLIEFGALAVRQRLIAELLRLSRDRGGGERVLSPPPSQHVLAARIAARRESVSRELAEMSRAGLLSVSRRAIILHQPETLRAEVEARL